MLYTIKERKRLRNRFEVNLARSKPDCLKWQSKSTYMWQKTFYNDLVGIWVTLTVNKAAFCWNVHIDLGKVLMCSKLLFTDTESLMYEI